MTAPARSNGDEERRSARAHPAGLGSSGGGSGRHRPGSSLLSRLLRVVPPGLLTHCIDGKRRFHGAARALTWKGRCGDHTGLVGKEKSSVVLLHGQPGSGSDWREVIARLPVTVECVAADRPGYRSSPHRAAGLLGNAEIVLADLDRAGIEQAVLVGHSYGGGVALTAAALAPHRVRGLVLVAASVQEQ